MNLESIYFYISADVRTFYDPLKLEIEMIIFLKLAFSFLEGSEKWFLLNNDLLKSIFSIYGLF